MSQQINLLNPAFHKVFDWLTAAPVAIATCVLLMGIGGATAWASIRADRQEQAASQRSKSLKETQERLVAMGKLVAESKPNEELANELSNTTALLRNREEIAKIIDGGAIGSTVGFAEFFRGFARQTPTGLWLTGFTIGAAGNEMEIRGRMINPAALPEYIRRLKTEPVFRGRSFASLTIQKPEESKEKKLADAQLAAAGKVGAPGVEMNKEVLPSFVDFILMPSATTQEMQAAVMPVSQPAAKSLPAAAGVPAGAQVAVASSTTPQKQGFVDPVLTPKSENLGRVALDEIKEANKDASKAHEEAVKKLQELLPAEKKP